MHHVKQGWLNWPLTICQLAVLAGVWQPQPAQADWGLAGAQYLCDEKANAFEVLPYERSSDDPPAGIPLQAGFKEIKSDHPGITCKISGRILHATISVLSPGNGQCEGQGLVRAESISVSGLELLPDRPFFDWACDSSDIPLVKIRVTLRESDLAVEKCYAKIVPAGAPPENHCDTNSIDINAVGSATAKQNNDLADPATQEFQSASRLPKENDFANVFLPPGPDGVPLCVHWLSSFSRSGVGSNSQDLTPHGRIAGKAGDRVYIHPANPQVCDASEEPLCRPKAYVVPGDRVDVGFVCGAWTYIRYLARTNASSNVLGWVGTNQLYAVDPMVSADPAKARAREEMGHDALLQAVSADELDRVTAMLADGRNPNGADMSGRALIIAISDENLALVKVLLTSGADPNVHSASVPCGQVVYSAVFATQEIFDALMTGGLKLTCGESILPWVAGSDRIAEADISISLNGIWAPKRDLSALTNRVIAAGVPVDSRRHDGPTALLATIFVNNVDVARALLNAGADPNIVMADSPGSGGNTALLRAMTAYPTFLDPTMIRVLLEGGASPNYKTAGAYFYDKTSMWNSTLSGVTPLHVAAEEGYFSLAKLLLEHGADPQIARSDGALAADIAREHHHLAVAALISRYSAQHATVTK
jgi:uncharacterized protein